MGVPFLSDEKLFQLCKKYGEQARFWRQKFLGLLPEVYRRKLFEKKGFGSINEFAAKMAGVSKKQVQRVLNLNKNFQDKPVLNSLLENGEVSVNKLAKIASIATVENQEILADQVRLLSCRGLETLVRDEKLAAHNRENANLNEQTHEVGAPENKNGLQKALFDQKSVHVNTFEPYLDDDVKAQLYELERKGIDINQLIRQMLQKREEEIAEEKEQLSAEAQPTNSRYIKVAVKNILYKEYGTKCSIKTCDKPSVQKHHAQRYGLAKIHDAKFMAPFCREHHQIAHTIDVKFHEVKLSKR